MPFWSTQYSFPILLTSTTQTGPALTSSRQGSPPMLAMVVLRPREAGTLGRSQGMTTSHSYAPLNGLRVLGPLALAMAGGPWTQPTWSAQVLPQPPSSSL